MPITLLNYGPRSRSSKGWRSARLEIVLQASLKVPWAVVAIGIGICELASARIVGGCKVGGRRVTGGLDRCGWGWRGVRVRGLARGRWERRKLNRIVERAIASWSGVLELESSVGGLRLLFLLLLLVLSPAGEEDADGAQGPEALHSQKS